MSNHHEVVETPGTVQGVRPKTRRVWDELTDSLGRVPKVREVYEVLGGQYPLCVKECKLLRDAAAADPEGDAPATDEPPEDAPVTAEYLPVPGDLPSREGYVLHPSLRHLTSEELRAEVKRRRHMSAPESNEHG